MKYYYKEKKKKLLESFNNKDNFLLKNPPQKQWGTTFTVNMCDICGLDIYMFWLFNLL